MSDPNNQIDTPRLPVLCCDVQGRHDQAGRTVSTFATERKRFYFLPQCDMGFLSFLLRNGIHKVRQGDIEMSLLAAGSNRPALMVIRYRNAQGQREQLTFCACCAAKLRESLDKEMNERKPIMN